MILPDTGTGLSAPSAGVRGVNTSYAIVDDAFPAGLVAKFERANTDAAGRKTAVVSILNVRAEFVGAGVSVTPVGRPVIPFHAIAPVSVGDSVCAIVTVLNAVVLFT